MFWRKRRGKPKAGERKNQAEGRMGGSQDPELSPNAMTSMTVSLF